MNTDEQIEAVLIELVHHIGKQVTADYSAKSGIYEGMSIKNVVSKDKAEAALKVLVKQNSFDLISRIKEEGPKDKKLKDGEGSMTSNTILIIQNEQNAKWRTAIDNIAKEIRGEGHE